MKAMLRVVPLSPFVDAGDDLAAGERADPLAAGMERLAIGLPQSSRTRACDKVDVPRRRFSRECSARGEVVDDTCRPSRIQQAPFGLRKRSTQLPCGLEGG